MRFLLDANFFLIPGKFKVDVFSEVAEFGKPELFTLDLVVRELERLAKGKGRDASHARLGLELLKENDVAILDSKGRNTDSEIVRFAREQDYVVCTQDRGIKKKLKDESLPVITLRQEKYLSKG